MKEQIFVKPKSGLRVMRPDTKRPLKEEGELVVKSSYWLRRLAGGEVEIVEQKAQAAKPVQQPKYEPKKKDDGGDK